MKDIKFDEIKLTKDELNWMMDNNLMIEIPLNADNLQDVILELNDIILDTGSTIATALRTKLKGWLEELL